MFLRSLTAVTALPLMFAACATETTTDELAGETAADDGGDGKADGAADGVYTYFEISTDMRKCASPVCGGFFLKRLNRSTTVCANGHASASCYTPELDWTQSNLDDDQQYKLLGASTQGASTEGVYGIVRGRFAAKTYPGHGNMGRFVVTEAWVAETAAMSDGVFVKVHDGGVRCIAAPCASTIEKGLNTSRFAMIADIDWSPAGLTSHEVEGFVNDLFQPSGAIVVGSRYTVTENGRKAKGRTATAAYHRLANPPGPCFVGGCSGQICSDQEGAISTCEWKAEYACYATATCERQTEGQCGWTDTTELSSCLATH
jgi:hypothetical protein